VRNFTKVILALAAAFAPLAIASALEVDAEKPIKKYDREPREGAVTAVAWSANGDYLGSAGEKGTVYVHDTATDEQKDRIQHGPPRRGVFVSCVVAYPKAPIFVHCSEFGVKFNLVGGRGKVPSFEPKHKKTVQVVDFSHDGDLMASGCHAGELIVWDLWTGDVKQRHQCVEKKPIYWLRYHPDGKRIAVACDGGKCIVYDSKAAKVVYEVTADEKACVAVDWSADGKWLATAGKDNKIRLWDAEDGKAGAVLEGHQDTIEMIAFHPKKGSESLASAADDKTVRIWDVVARKETQKIACDAKMNAVAWRPDGGALAVGGGDKVQVFAVKGAEKSGEDKKKDEDKK
jgi:WD40 repeat protein